MNGAIIRSGMAALVIGALAACGGGTTVSGGSANDALHPTTSASASSVSRGSSLETFQQAVKPFTDLMQKSNVSPDQLHAETQKARSNLDALDFGSAVSSYDYKKLEYDLGFLGDGVIDSTAVVKDIATITKELTSGTVFPTSTAP